MTVLSRAADHTVGQPGVDGRRRAWWWTGAGFLGDGDRVTVAATAPAAPLGPAAPAAR